MATSKKSGLSCAKSTQRVKLEVTRKFIDHRGLRIYDNKSRSGFYLAGSTQSVFISDLTGAGGVDFRVAEELARAHYAGSASHENAPLVAFVSRQDYSAGVHVWLL